VAIYDLRICRYGFRINMFQVLDEFIQGLDKITLNAGRYQHPRQSLLDPCIIIKLVILRHDFLFGENLHTNLSRTCCY
jgi:hypothetical protein